MAKGNLSVKTTPIRPAPKGSKFVSEIPSGAGHLVATLIFEEKLFVTCEYALFCLQGDKLVQIKFQV